MRPINRLFTPAQIPQVQPFVLPYEQIAQGLLSAQKQQDDLNTIIGDIEASSVNSILPHRDEANKIIGEIITGIDEIANRSETGDLRGLQSEIKKYARKTAREFLPTGRLGQIQKAYDDMKAWYDRESKNKDADPRYLSAMLQTLYDQTSTDFNDPNFNVFETAPGLAKQVVATKWADDYLKGIQPYVRHTIIEQLDLPYDITFEDMVKQVGPERILEVAQGYMDGDSQLKHYRDQGVAIGVYTPESFAEEFNSALYGALQKYVVDESKIGRTYSLNQMFDKLESTDPNPQGQVLSGEQIPISSGKVIPKGVKVGADGTFEAKPTTWQFITGDKSGKAARARQQAANELNDKLNNIRSNNPNKTSVIGKPYGDMTNAELAAEVQFRANSMGAIAQQTFVPSLENDVFDKFIQQQISTLAASGGMNSTVREINPETSQGSDGVSLTTILHDLGYLNNNGTLTSDASKMYPGLDSSNKGHVLLLWQKIVADAAYGVDLVGAETAGDILLTIPRIKGKGGNRTIAINGTNEMKAAAALSQVVTSHISDFDLILKVSQGETVVKKTGSGELHYYLDPNTQEMRIKSIYNLPDGGTEERINSVESIFETTKQRLENVMSPVHDIQTLLDQINSR